jgi:hypothetical protein
MGLRKSQRAAVYLQTPENTVLTVVVLLGSRYSNTATREQGQRENKAGVAKLITVEVGFASI